jgi:hypothetical protein
MAKRYKTIDTLGQDDFGFSTEAIKPEYNPEVADLKERLKAIRKIYLPMLEKLKENPDNEIIKWPNRLEVIEKQIKKLIELTEV